MKIFKELEKARNKKRIKNADEYKFYQEHKTLLSQNAYFDKYNECTQLFDIICANIVINGIINKNTLDNLIEEEYFDNKNENVELIKQNIKEKTLDLPYAKINDLKIYIPFFDYSTNEVYSNNNEKMFQEPYIYLRENFKPFLCNPFLYYGVDLFNSLFTKLIMVDESATCVAYYHYDFDAIFVINRQGGLDNTIFLFDKRLKKPKRSNIVERIRPLIKSYFDGNINDFIYLLYKNELISYKVFRKICNGKKL